MGVPETDPLSQLSLPPGFRFYPTDEELLVQYLCRKVAGQQFSLQIIGEIDLYKFDPWVLPSKAIFGEKEWYFFSPRDRKYPNGSRPNRVAGSGYWKATGTDKVITTEGRKVGIKKALVFYVGKAPKGTKTNWIMHEYRLFEPSRKNGSTKLDEWVLCRIYKKNSGGQKPMTSVSTVENSHGSSSSSSSQYDDVLDSLPEIDDRFFPLPRNATPAHHHHEEKLNLQSLTAGNFDWASLAAVSSSQLISTAQSHHQQFPSAPQNDVFVHSFPSLCQVDSTSSKAVGRSVEEEVQSGMRNQRFDGSFFPQGSSGFGTGFGSSLDPIGVRFGQPQPAEFGYRM